MTIKNHEKKEKIIGFGSKEIMNVVYRKKLNYQRFLDSDYMKNKQIYQVINISLNSNEYIIYLINPIRKKQNKKNTKSCLSKQSTILQDAKFNKGKKKSVVEETITENMLSESEKKEEEIIDNENNNVQNIINFIEDNQSQSSALTRSSLSSYWNVNKTQVKDIQNSFSSKNSCWRFFIIEIRLLK